MNEYFEALEKGKERVLTNILDQIQEEGCDLEKARTVGQLGETRTWGGKEYIKTAKGWRPKPKGGSKSGSGDPEEKKVPGASDSGWPKGSSQIHHALDVMGGSKYSDPSKVSLDYDDEYGWSVSYDGKEVGSLSKNAISKEDAKAAGWYKDGSDSDGKSSGDKNPDEGVKEDTKKTEGSGKEKKLTIKERDSQNISKVKDILKNVGISKNADVRVHRGGNGQRFYTYSGGGHVPYQFTLRDTGDFTLRDGGIANIMGKIDNEADVKKMNTYVKGNEILNKMRSALKEDQGSMASLVKELQELL